MYAPSTFVIVPSLYIAPPPSFAVVPVASLFLNTVVESIVIVLPDTLYIAPPLAALFPDAAESPPNVPLIAFVIVPALYIAPP